MIVFIYLILFSNVLMLLSIWSWCQKVHRHLGKQCQKVGPEIQIDVSNQLLAVLASLLSDLYSHLTRLILCSLVFSQIYRVF
jgi:hypothetical protein